MFELDKCCILSFQAGNFLLNIFPGQVVNWQCWQDTVCVPWHSVHLKCCEFGHCCYWIITAVTIGVGHIQDHWPSSNYPVKGNPRIEVINVWSHKSVQTLAGAFGRGKVNGSLLYAHRDHIVIHEDMLLILYYQIWYSCAQTYKVQDDTNIKNAGDVMVYINVREGVMQRKAWMPQYAEQRNVVVKAQAGRPHFLSCAHTFWSANTHHDA